MYSSYFGLNENPFSIAPDPLYLFMSEKHRDALAHLQYGVRTDGGFVLLTGEVGAGKTTLCRSLLEQLPDDVDVAFVLNPKLSVNELLETICDELHINYPAQGSIKQLVDRLNAYLLDSHASGRKTVLIIDEAQNLSIDVLEQLRLLTNLETNRYKLLQIVLLGQPELLQLLNRQEMRQLSQRITARFHLGPLDVNEIGDYIQHRLRVAGCNLTLIPQSLHKMIWQMSGGIPRLINLICDRSLLGAYVRECQCVDEQILRQAADEVLGRSSSRAITWKKLLPAAVFGALLILLMIGFWSWKEQAPEIMHDTVYAEPSAGKTENSVTSDALSPEAASAAENDTPLPASWPDGFAMTQSQAEAFNDLVRLWGLPVDPQRSDYCTYARELGLECLARTDSLERLRTINRPAILTLYGDDGSPFHVVMTHLDQDRVKFIAGNNQQELSLSAITSRWYGNYLLLWQPPPTGRSLTRPGDTGAAIPWLADTLSNLGLYRATGREARFSGELLGAFKKFQFSQGLTPDGVLGPMSMIHLNTARNSAGPRLYSPGAG